MDTATDNPASATTVPGLFKFMGFCYFGLGLYSLPIALFVGPHLLAASAGCAVVGVGCLLIARRLKRHSRRAWWAGLLLLAAVMAVSALAIAQSAQEGDTAGSIVFCATLAWHGGVMVALLRHGRIRGVEGERE